MNSIALTAFDTWVVPDTVPMKLRAAAKLLVEDFVVFPMKLKTAAWSLLVLLVKDPTKFKTAVLVVKVLFDIAPTKERAVTPRFFEVLLATVPLKDRVAVRDFWIRPAT